jgi:hypothetical protein
MYIMILRCMANGLGLFSKGIVSLWLIKVPLYYDLFLQGKRFRVVFTGVLGLGLMMVYFHYDTALQGRRFRLV